MQAKQTVIKLSNHIISAWENVKQHCLPEDGYRPYMVKGHLVDRLTKTSYELQFSSVWAMWRKRAGTNGLSDFKRPFDDLYFEEVSQMRVFLDKNAN